MIRQAHTAAREVIVADAIGDVVAELRMVDAADYVAFVKFEQFACIADLVASAAELYFQPGVLRLGHGGEAHVTWESPPRIVLDLELRPSGVTIYFRLTLASEHAGIDVTYVSFDNADPDPDRNTAFMKAAVDATRIRRREPEPMR